MRACFLLRGKMKQICLYLKKNMDIHYLQKLMIILICFGILVLEDIVIRSDLPNIKIWKDADGKIWTLDHRRLAAFRIAGLDEVPFQWATQEEIAGQMWKMTTKTNGKSMIVD